MAGESEGEKESAEHSGSITASEPIPELKWLRALVTGLAVVMGLGMVALIALMWWRLAPSTESSLPTLPPEISLPEDVTAEAVTFAKDWIVVVGEAGEILLFSRSGELVNRVAP